MRSRPTSARPTLTPPNPHSVQTRLAKLNLKDADLHGVRIGKIQQPNVLRLPPAHDPSGPAQVHSVLTTTRSLWAHLNAKAAVATEAWNIIRTGTM